MKNSFLIKKSRFPFKLKHFQKLKNFNGSNLKETFARHLQDISQMILLG